MDDLFTPYLPLSHLNRCKQGFSQSCLFASMPVHYSVHSSTHPHKHTQNSIILTYGAGGMHGLRFTWRCLLWWLPWRLFFSYQCPIGNCSETSVQLKWTLLQMQKTWLYLRHIQMHSFESTPLLFLSFTTVLSKHACMQFGLVLWYIIVKCYILVKSHAQSYDLHNITLMRMHAHWCNLHLNTSIKRYTWLKMLGLPRSESD